MTREKKDACVTYSFIAGVGGKSIHVILIYIEKNGKIYLMLEFQWILATLRKGSELHMRNILIGVATIAFLLVTIFLLDLEDGPGTFFFVCLPFLISLLGITVVSIGVQRKKKEYKSKWYFIVGSI